MPLVGALAAAFALLATEIEPQQPGVTSAVAPPALITSVAAMGVTGGYVAGMLETLTGPGCAATNGPQRDGMSYREQRPGDLSGQTTLPIVVGRF